MMPETAPPIACHLDAMTPEQRQGYDRLKDRLRAALSGILERPDGYRFDLTPGAMSLTEVAEFVTLESLCCPFFAFTLRFEPHGSAVSLEVIGPAEAKAILQDALAPI